MRRLTVCTIAILVLLSTRIVLAQTTARESAGALGSLSGFVLNPWITPALVLLGMVLIIAELVSIGSWGATGTAGVLCLGAVVGSSILAGVAVTVGLALLLGCTRTAFELMTSPAHRAEYRAAQGDFPMDLGVIGEGYPGWPLERVAGLYLLACLLTPVVALVAHRLLGRAR